MLSSGTFPEIARWWRQRQKAAARGGAAPIDRNINNGAAQSTNPRTLLLSVTRCVRMCAGVLLWLTRECLRSLRGGVGITAMVVGHDAIRRKAIVEIVVCCSMFSPV